MDRALRARLDKCLSSPIGGGAYGVLVDFQRSGGTMGVALETLRSLCRNDDEDYDDRVLELIDFVVGWCVPDQWIYRDAQFPFSVDIPDAMVSSETDGEIMRWCNANGMDWRGNGDTFEFASKADAENFRKTWLS